MEYVEATDSPPTTLPLTNVFLAGGITGCPDWQSYVAKQLEDLPLRLYNPRRRGFDVAGDLARSQIEWEFNALSLCDVVLFWFPQESLCPISLYELGRINTMHGKKRIFIGTHPHYVRREDVVVQTQLATQGSSSGTIFHDLEEMVAAVRNFLCSGDS